ncbi:MAG: N-formylglutamate amidohydrolase [Sphingomonadales bacterium]
MPEDELPPLAPPFRIDEPRGPLSACVFASPHSGRHYPPAFLARARLGLQMLRRSEDSFVDELFAHAPAAGAPLIKATYPRAYLDPNRGPYELDPAMFDQPLPDYAETASERVAGGLGTIPRTVGAGLEIYDRPLCLDAAMARIETIHRPYHDALCARLERANGRHGFAVLIDCHSMPSLALERGAGFSRPAPDIVLGNRFGGSCDPRVFRLADSLLRDLGLTVTHNDPYAGGYTTRRYGQPQAGMHALQIEIARGLYMDEMRIEKHRGFESLAKVLTRFIDRFVPAIAALALAADGDPATPLAAE